jgi:hypothetical protein
LTWSVVSQSYGFNRFFHIAVSILAPPRGVVT